MEGSLHILDSRDTTSSSSSSSNPLTQQSTAGHLTGFSDAADHRGGHVNVQDPAGEVVEEEERLGALSQNVVHTHGHQVLPQAAVLAARLRDLMKK